MRRIFAYLAVVLLPCAAVAQDDDRGFLQGFIEDNLSGAGREVRIEGFAGALSSEATLDRLTIADDAGVWLTLENVTLDWSRAALLRGRVDVERLTAETILLPRLPEGGEEAEVPDAAAPGFSLPELPVSISIGEISANRIALGAPVIGVEAELSLAGSLTLADGEGMADLQLQRIDGARGVFDLGAGYSNESGVLELGVALDEGPGGIVATLAGFPGEPSVQLDIEGTGALDDFTAGLRLATDGVERLAGDLRIGGSEDGVLFEARIGGDIAPLFMPEYREFFGPDITLVAQGRRGPDGSLSLDALDLDARQIALSGSYASDAQGIPTAFDVTARVGSDDGAPVLLPIPGEETRIDRADLRLSFDAAVSDDWSGAFTVSGLDRPGLRAEDLAVDGTGRIGLTPEDRSYDVALDFSASDLDLSDPDAEAALGEEVTGRLRVQGAPGAGVRIDELSVNGASYEASISGTLDTVGRDLTFDGNVAVAARDLSAFAGLAQRPLSGAVEASLSGSAALLGGTFDLEGRATTDRVTVGIPEVDRLLGDTATLDFAAIRDETGFAIPMLAVETPVARLDGSARLASETSEVDLVARLDDIGVLLPGLDGAHRFQLDAEAQGARWTLAADLDGALATARAAGLLDLEAEEPIFDGQAEVSSARISDIARELLGVALPELQVSAAAAGRFAANPALIDLTFDAEAQTDDLPLWGGRHGARVSGQANGRTVTGQARVAGEAVNAVVDGTFGLDGTPSFDGTARVSLSDLAPVGAIAGLGGLSGAVEADIEGSLLADLSAFDLGATATARNLTTGIAAADPLIGATVSVALDAARDGGDVEIGTARIDTGPVTAELSGTLGEESGALTLAATIDDIGRVAAGFSGPAAVDATANRANGGPWSVDADASGPGGARLSADGSVAEDFATLDLAVTGALPLGIANPFIAPRTLGGMAALDLRVSGPPALSSVSGVVTTSDARLVAPTLGISIERGQGNVRLANSQAAIDFGASVEGGGRLGVRGDVSLAAPFEGDIDVRLDGVRLSDPQLYETQVSGTVTLEGPLTGGARIEGRLTLDQTEIRIPSGATGGAQPIPDIVHIGAPDGVRSTLDRAGLSLRPEEEAETGSGGVAFPLDIRISTANQIFVRGRGLEAELGGTLRIRGTTDNIVPEGRFELIRGRLDILGKRLVLNEGAIVLEGDFVPRVRLVAESQAEDVTVLIVIEGPADAPEISFLSEPELPQDEVIARLLFGKGIETLSPLQAAQLAASVATLTGRGGEGIVGKIRSGAGLDDLDVTTTEEGSAAVRAGKYLSDNIYTDVEVGSDGTAAIELNLDLTPSVTVTGRTSNTGETGIGIYYERDY